MTIKNFLDNLNYKLTYDWPTWIVTVGIAVVALIIVLIINHFIYSVTRNIELIEYQGMPCLVVEDVSRMGISCDWRKYSDN